MDNGSKHMQHLPPDRVFEYASMDFRTWALSIELLPSFSMLESVPFSSLLKYIARLACL